MRPTLPVRSLAGFPVLADLARQLSADPEAAALDWLVVHEITGRWLAAQHDLLTELRRRLRVLSDPVRAELAAGSRETTTHFAWRLVHGQAMPFSFWLHQYKPQTDWWRGYANSVHNHRYHFCTTVLTGSYQHEWYDVRLDAAGELAREVTWRGTEVWRPGPVRALTADQFHRVPRAADGTITFLVKSRPVRGWSLSVDPSTNFTRRHIPVEVLATDLADRL